MPSETLIGQPVTTSWVWRRNAEKCQPLDHDIISVIESPDLLQQYDYAQCSSVLPDIITVILPT
jgi:hypothetical protein